MGRQDYGNERSLRNTGMRPVLYGFDVYVGILHTQFFHRKSLVCDLEEPFRPIIDAALIKALNLGQINEKDFWKNQEQYILPWKNSAPYIELFIKAIMEYKNEIFIYLQSYYRAFVQKKNAEDFPFFDLDEQAIAQAGHITYGSNVKEVTTQVREGSADCGVIYATDAFSAKLKPVDEATKAMCGQVIYPAAVMKNSKHPQEAQAFLDYLKGQEAMTVFQRVGFSPVG